MSEDVLEKLGERIREQRKLLGMTQEELASIAGLDRSYVGGIERGERNVSISMLSKLCLALNCDIASLTHCLPVPTE